MLLVVKIINAGASRELNLFTDSSMDIGVIGDLTAINLNSVEDESLHKWSLLTQDDREKLALVSTLIT